jgi:hypothetical protein
LRHRNVHVAHGQQRAECQQPPFVGITVVGVGVRERKQLVGASSEGCYRLAELAALPPQ